MIRDLLKTDRIWPPRAILGGLRDRLTRRGNLARPVQPSDTRAFTYDAFICYRRVDGLGLAKWLRDRLQSYRIPRAVRRHLAPDARGRDGTRLRVFRDEDYEGADEDFWQKFIVPNLQRARHLIVISTPGAFAPRSDGQPNWLSREIEAFVELRRTDPRRRIMLVLGPGAPEDRFPGRLDDPALGDGIERPRWNWADLRAFSIERVRSWRWRLGFDDQFAKIVAPLHDVPSELIPALRREGLRRLVIILAGSLFAVTIIAAAIGALGAFAYQQMMVAQGRLEQALISQSRFLVDRASGYESAGEPALALATVLEALPSDFHPPDRPIVSKAVVQAYRQYHRFRGNEVLLRRSTDAATRVAFSPTGGDVLIGYESGAIISFDHRLKQPTKTWAHSAKSISAIEYRPDGKGFAAAASDGSLRMIGADGQSKDLAGHSEAIAAVRFSSSGNLIATYDYSGFIKIQTANGEIRGELEWKDDVFNRLEFSPDERKLLISTGDRFGVFDLEERRVTRSHLLSDLKGLGIYWLGPAHFLSNGKIIVPFSTRDLAGTGGQAWVVDHSSTQPRQDVSANRRIEQIIVRPGSPHCLIVTSEAVEIRRLDENGDLKRFDRATDVRIESRGAEFVAAAFSSDEKSVVTVARDGVIRIWASTGPLEAVIYPRPPLSMVYSEGVRYDRATNLLAVGSTALFLTPRLFDTTAAAVRDVPARYTGSSFPMFFRSGEVLVKRDTELGSKPASVFEVVTPEGHARTLFSSDEVYLAWGIEPASDDIVLVAYGGRVEFRTRDGELRRSYRIQDRVDVRQQPAPREGRGMSDDDLLFRRAAVSGNGRRLVVWTSEGAAFLLSAEGAPIARFKYDSRKPEPGLDISFDGRLVIADFGDGTSYLWRDDETIEQFRSKSDYKPTELSLDRRFLAKATETTFAIHGSEGPPLVESKVIENCHVSHVFVGASARRYGVVCADRADDQQTGIAIVNSPGQVVARVQVPGDRQPVEFAAFDPSGERFLAVTRGAVYVWSSAGELLAELEFPGHDIKWASFTPDGTRVVGVGGGMSSWIRVWDLFRSVEDMILRARAILPHCLGPEHRRTLDLSVEPPGWCRRSEP